MTDDSSPKALEDWEMTPEQKRDVENEFLRKCDEEQKKYWDTFWEDKGNRKKRLVLGGNMWGPPSPRNALAMIWCDNSSHRKGDWGWQNYWIAVRWTEDEKAFELVRTEKDDEIVENYPGRYENFDHALLAANALSWNWDKTATDVQVSAMSEERDLSRNLKLNPWGRAVWERKDPDGPVLVVWQLEPLALFVAGWLPFAGSRCIPSLVQFAYESDPTRVCAVVDALGENAYDAGPSDKMIARAKSIAASYAANGRKGGRPKKKQKDGQVEG